MLTPEVKAIYDYCKKNQDVAHACYVLIATENDYPMLNLIINQSYLIYSSVCGFIENAKPESLSVHDVMNYCLEKAKESAEKFEDHMSEDNFLKQQTTMTWITTYYSICHFIKNNFMEEELE